MKCVSMAKRPLKASDVDKVRVKNLERLLTTYSRFLSSNERDHIVQAFKFRCYSAIIKLYNKNLLFFKNKQFLHKN